MPEMGMVKRPAAFFSQIPVQGKTKGQRRDGIHAHQCNRLSDRGHFMAAAPVKAGIGHIQQFGHKGWVLTNDISDFFRIGFFITAHLKDLQG